MWCLNLGIQRLWSQACCTFIRRSLTFALLLCAAHLGGQHSEITGELDNEKSFTRHTNSVNAQFFSSSLCLQDHENSNSQHELSGSVSYWSLDNCFVLWYVSSGLEGLQVRWTGVIRAWMTRHQNQLWQASHCHCSQLRLFPWTCTVMKASPEKFVRSRNDGGPQAFERCGSISPGRIREWGRRRLSRQTKIFYCNR